MIITYIVSIIHSLLCLLHLSYETRKVRRQCSGRRTEFWVAYIRLNPRVKGLCNPCWFLVPATLPRLCFLSLIASWNPFFPSGALQTSVLHSVKVLYVCTSIR